MRKVFFIMTVFMLIASCKAFAQADSIPADSSYHGDSSEIFLFVQEPALFIGEDSSLQEYFRKRIQFKGDIEHSNLRTIYVSYVIEKDGAISNVHILRSSLDLYLDWQVKEIVERMPAWKPGKKDGKIVRSKMTIPIRIELY